MHMIVMGSELFAMRLFRMHLEHCRRVNGDQWREYRIWSETEVLQMPGFDAQLYSQIDHEALKEDYLKLFLL